MNRIVQPELLDVLPVNDPKAIRSRQDLRRLNAFMGHIRMLAQRLEPFAGQSRPLRIVELGAGDGSCLLRVAQRLARRTPASPIDATLVDLQNLLRPETEREFRNLNWQVRAVAADVFDFLKLETARADIILANLFLHHFTDAQLKELLNLCSQRTTFFLALETRRARMPLVAGWLVGAIGCNAVTRHDAVVSVEAGFAENELSRLWPRAQHWQLEEHSAGLFSHAFAAQQTN